MSGFLDHLVGRLTGPMTFRLLLQPIAAIAYAIRDGVRDARHGRQPYLWHVFTDAAARRRLLQEGVSAVGRVILLAVLMDAVYQFIVFGWVHPLELIVVVLALAFVPYLLVRGPVNRIARWWMGRRSTSPQG